MKPTRSTPTLPWRPARSSLLAIVALASAPFGYAASFTATTPMPAYTTGSTMNTINSPTLGSFDFTSVPYTSFESIQSISITLSLYNLQTMATGGGQERRDYDKISLTLGGVNTGLKLNGYGLNVTSTVTTTGTPTAVTGSAILAALAANNGILQFGIFDSKTTPANLFDFGQGFNVTSLTLNVTQSAQPVPFSPSAVLGFGVVGAVALLRGWPRLKDRLRALCT